jgi:Rha family phage regulatory protein
MELVVNLVRRGDTFYVSSREVAEKFGKRHDNVLRAIDSLQVPDSFRLLNFEECFEEDSNDIDRRVFYMTRDGFTILAFGFTGSAALKWKLNFLAAFNKMEAFILEKVPLLERENRALKETLLRLEERRLMLEEPKKTHGNKGTVLVPVTVTTLFGQEVEYRRVPKGSDNYSDLSYKEGELKQLTQLVGGMARKMDSLAKEVAHLRRK